MSRGGSIRKLSNGKWQWVGYYKDNSGVIHRPTKSFKTQKEAEQYRSLQAEEEKHINNIVNETDYTVSAFYELWKEQTEWDTERNYTFTTTNNWQYMFKKHILPYIGAEKIQNICYDRLQEYFNRQEYSKKTYSNILQAIKSMLGYAKTVDEDYIIIDNIHKVKITTIKKPKAKVFNVLSETDYQDIIQYLHNVKSYYAPLVELLHETGLRIEEALALTVDDVNFKNKHLSITKAIKRKSVNTSKKKKDKNNTKLEFSKYLKSASAYRSVPLTEYAQRAVEAQLIQLKKRGIQSIYLFPTTAGNLGDSRNVLRAFHSAIKMCNRNRVAEEYIPQRGLHSLRKLYCKRLRDQAKFDWEIIASILGHSNISVTQNYYYSITEDDIALYAKRINSVDSRLEEERLAKTIEGADIEGLVVVDGIAYENGVFMEEE